MDSHSDSPVNMVVMVSLSEMPRCIILVKVMLGVNPEYGLCQCRRMDNFLDSDEVLSFPRSSLSIHRQTLSAQRAYLFAFHWAPSGMKVRKAKIGKPLGL